MFIFPAKTKEKGLFEAQAFLKVPSGMPDQIPMQLWGGRCFQRIPKAPNTHTIFINRSGQNDDFFHFLPPDFLLMDLLLTFLEHKLPVEIGRSNGML